MLQASLEEVDTELALVRKELQKVWDMLKTRDTALEEQHLELESARSQVPNLSEHPAETCRVITLLFDSRST